MFVCARFGAHILTRACVRLPGLSVQRRAIRRRKTYAEGNAGGLTGRRDYRAHTSTHTHTHTKTHTHAHTHTHTHTHTCTHTHTTRICSRARSMSRTMPLYSTSASSFPYPPLALSLRALPPSLPLSRSVSPLSTPIPFSPCSFSPALSYLAGTTLGNAGIELIVSSPLTRALHTATLAHGHARVCMYAL